jgi:hypothetical protein
LLDIPIMRISNWQYKAQDKIEALEGIEQVKHNLEHLIDCYFTKLKKYGKDANAKQSYEFWWYRSNQSRFKE